MARQLYRSRWFLWFHFTVVGLLLAVLGGCVQQGPNLTPIEGQADSQRFKGFSAEAGFDSFVDCTQTWVWLFATEGSDQASPGPGTTDAFVDIAIDRYDVCLGEPLTSAYGFAPLDTGALRFQGNLNAASLVTTVEVYDWVTDSSFEVAVDVTWKGGGGLTREKFHQQYSSDGYRVNLRYQGVFRQAQANGSVSDGSTEFTPRPSAWAWLAEVSQGMVTVQQGGRSRLPVIDFFFADPAVVDQGDAVTLSWQVDSKSPTTLTLEPEVGDVSGLTSVTVTPDATTEYLLTATNRHGSASAYALVLVVVPDELEVNDTPELATPIALDFVSPELTVTPGDVDWFAFELTAPGTVIADIDAVVLGSALDSVLGLFDSALGEIAINDDDFDSFDSRLEVALPAGSYLLAVSGFADFGFAGDHHQNGFYYLDVSFSP